MIFGVPTHTRYDLLDRLLASVAAGDETPSTYVIVDNGVADNFPGYTAERARSFIGWDVSLVYLPMGRNLGVAAAWNIILDIAEDVIIANDDVVFGKTTFREMADALRSGERFVSVDGWALFGQTARCLEEVGYYDENFWPAYYEDVDYAIRLKKKGVDVVKIKSEGFRHDGWATVRALDDPEWLSKGRYVNRLYLIAKWRGHGWESVCSPELYAEEFNGSRPPWWSERTRVKQIPTRWEIADEIATLIEAERYLAVGPEAVRSMGEVIVGERWGVHEGPASPHAACSFNMAFPDFARGFGAKLHGKFDLIFLDAHLADEVFRDVELALPLLREGGVCLVGNANPYREAIQKVPAVEAEWTGDVWRGVAVCRRTIQYPIHVIDADYGVMVLVKREWLTYCALPAETWSDLERERRKLLGIVDWWDWQKLF